MEFERIFLGTALAASVGVTDTTFGQAEQYPSKLVRVALPYTAGSPNDVVARHSVLHLSIRLGQSVIVNSKLSGSTSIGSKSVTTSRPDGYTLLFSNDGTHYVASLGNKEIAYYPIADFTPTATSTRNSLILLVGPSVPANSV
jgi:tripartite-type tricarboxylate transporter receptor subunit TctC